MTVDEFKRRMSALIDEFAESATAIAREQLLAAAGATTPVSRRQRAGSIQAEAVRLFNEGKKYGEIARLLGSSTDSIGTALHRARKRGLVSRRNKAVSP